MTKLIIADDFIEEMKEPYNKAGWESGEVHFSLNDIIANIELMPYTDGWIDMADRIPEHNNERYLVTIATVFFDKCPNSYRVTTAQYNNNLHELSPYDFPNESDNCPGWYNYDIEQGFYRISAFTDKYIRVVTAWMPMPEPYKGEFQ